MQHFVATAPSLHFVELLLFSSNPDERNPSLQLEVQGILDAAAANGNITAFQVSFVSHEVRLPYGNSLKFVPLIQQFLQSEAVSRRLLFLSMSTGRKLQAPYASAWRQLFQTINNLSFSLNGLSLAENASAERTGDAALLTEATRQQIARYSTVHYYKYN